MVLIQYELTEAGDSTRKILSIQKDRESIITVGNNDAVLRENYEERKQDGYFFLPGLGLVRRVAHIDINTVKLLASQGDHDAKEYLEGSTSARDRMIRNHPELFKACSGNV